MKEMIISAAFGVLLAAVVILTTFIGLLRRRGNMLKAATAKAETEAVELRKVLDKQKEEIAALRASSTERENAFESLRRDLDAAKAATAEIQTEANSLREAKAAADARFAAAQGEVHKEKERHSQALKRLEEQHAQAIKQMKGAFAELSRKALDDNQKSFLELAAQRFEKTKVEADAALQAREKAVSGLVKPVVDELAKIESQLKEVEKGRAKLQGELAARLSNTEKATHNLKNETINLTNTLINPQGGGQWGEMQLTNVVQSAGMLEHCDFDAQVAADEDDAKREKVDMVIRLPNKKIILVDAKTSFREYFDAVGAADKNVREKALHNYIVNIKTHLNNLGSKNYQEKYSNALEFVVMFLPAEGMFSVALRAEPSLMEMGLSKNVLIASPITLIALLKSAYYGWRHAKLEENARVVTSIGEELCDRFITMWGYFAAIGKGLGGAVEAYNKTIGSAQRNLMPQMKRFTKAIDSPKSKDMPELKEVKETLRGAKPQFGLGKKDEINIDVKDENRQVDEDGTAADVEMNNEKVHSQQD